MAQAVTESERSRVGLVTRRTAPVAQHARRFWLAYVALAVVLGAAVGGAIVAYGGRTSAAKTVSWSTWRPADVNSVATLEEIARHVQPRYRLANGQQLASVIPKVAAVTTQDQQIPISAVVIHTGFPLDSPRDLTFGLVNRGAMYILCGSGTSCTIPGSATVTRGQLTRREALELALYTFAYTPSADSVLAFVPPTAADPTAKRLLLLQRADVAPLLRRPLADTLRPVARIAPDEISKREQALIDRVTRFHFYTVKDSTQLADGTVALVLYPPSP